MTIPFPTSQERSPSPICHSYVLTAMKRRWQRRKAGSWEADSIPGRWPRSRRRRPSCSLSSGDRTSPHIRLHLFRTHTQTEFCQPESQRNACQCPGQGRQTRGKGKEVERVSSFAPPPGPHPSSYSHIQQAMFCLNPSSRTPACSRHIYLNSVPLDGRILIGWLFFDLGCKS